MNFICKNCNDVVEVKSFEDVVKMEKLCVFCRRKLKHKKGVNTFKKNHKIHINKCSFCESDIETFINRNGQPNKKFCDSHCYHKYHKKQNNLICQYCNKPFLGFTAKYCSSECRAKGAADCLFKKNLKEVNKLIEIQNIRIFGFGSSRYEDNKIKKIIKNNDKSEVF